MIATAPSPVKSFRDRFRDEKNIRDMRKNKTAAGFRQEGLGIWSKNGKGWYTKDLIDRAFRLGNERGVRPMVTRKDDWETDKERLNQCYYFQSGDPARHETKGADDGALVIGRATPRVDKPGCEPLDWQFDFVWAYLMNKRTLTEWSATMHRKHQQFGFSGIILDAGPAGGGNFLKPELAKSKQMIRDREVKVKPIATEEDESMMVTADFILSMFKRNDAKILKLVEAEKFGEWTGRNMRGDDVIIDAAHSSFHNALDFGVIGFTPKLREVPPAVKDSWSEEKRKSCYLIQLGAQQLTKITFRTEDDGTTYYSKNQAREFSSKSKKDFAWAMVQCYVRFLQWLQEHADEAMEMAEEDAGQVF